MSVLTTDDSKPWKPALTVEVRTPRGLQVVDASTPYLTLGKGDTALVVSIAAAGHIHHLHIDTKEPASRFAFDSVSSLFTAITNLIPKDRLLQEGVQAFAINLGRSMGAEGIASMSELVADGVLPQADVDVARLVRDEVMHLNATGSLDEKRAMAARYRTEHPDSKIQFILVRGSVLVPTVAAPKRETTELFLAMGPAESGAGKTLYTAAPGRFMPRHPDPAQFADEGVSGPAFREAAAAWFDTVMLVDN